MDEMRVSATDFRVHLKDLGNQVSRDGAVVIVSRHGLELGVFISADEYDEFRKFRQQQMQQQGNQPAVLELPMEHPDRVPVEELERIYKATADSEDPDVWWWRGKAAISLRVRTGRYPDDPPS